MQPGLLIDEFLFKQIWFLGIIKLVKLLLEVYVI
jgi:hypothetical protein